MPNLTVRQLIERALTRVDDGSPRMLIRINLLNALERLNESGLTPIDYDENGPYQYRLITDTEPEADA